MQRLKLGSGSGLLGAGLGSVCGVMWCGVCVCVCVQACHPSSSQPAPVPAYTHMHRLTDTPTCMQTRKNTVIPYHAYKHVSTLTQVHRQTDSYIHMHTYTHTHTPTHIHSHTYMHIHTYIHTYMHT